MSIGASTHGCPACTCPPPLEWLAPRRRPWRLPTAESAPKLFPAWVALEAMLAGGPRSRVDLVEGVAAHVAGKTAANLLRNAEMAGALVSFRGVGGALWYRLPEDGGGSEPPTPRSDGALSDEQVRSLPIGELEALGFERLNEGQWGILTGARLEELDEKQVCRIWDLMDGGGGA